MTENYQIIGSADNSLSTSNLSFRVCGNRWVYCNSDCCHCVNITTTTTSTTTDYKSDNSEVINNE